MRPAARFPAAALAAGGLAACSPADEPLLAVGRNPDGRPVLHLRLCGDAHAAHNADITLRGPRPAPPTATPGSATPGSGGAGGDLWRIWNSTGAGTWWTIEFGTTPDGWREEPTAQVPAPGPVRFAPGASYIVSAFTKVPQPSSVEFTLADLDGLEAGEVWGHRGRDPDEVAIPLTTFRKQADDVC